MSQFLQYGVVVGLVGDVCAGKSEVRRRLAVLGAEVYDADLIVRGLYELPDVKTQVRALLGDAVFDSVGNVSRSAVADRVFHNAGLRQTLTETIIFPRTAAILNQQLQAFRATAGPTGLLLVDAPTLFEAGRAGLCDRILFVTAPIARRREWAKSRGWADGEIERREAALIPAAEKLRRADFVIDNRGPLDELHAQVDQIWRAITQQSGNTLANDSAKT